jgi:hypothetical protein
MTLIFLLLLKKIGLPCRDMRMASRRQHAETAAMTARTVVFLVENFKISGSFSNG